MHRKKDGKEYWVFPGGHTEIGETPEQTIRREVWEELSLKITKIKGQYPYTHGVSGANECFFVCEVGDGEPKIDPSGTEKITETDWYQPKWVNLSWAKKLDNLYPEAIKRRL